MIFEQIVEKLIASGMKETEAKVYASVVISGKIGPSSIARALKTTGPNISMIARPLLKKGLIVKEGGKYTLADPTSFIQNAYTEAEEIEQKAEKQKQTAGIIAETLNKAYLESSGRPIVRLLNLNQWKDFKEKFFFEGNDKTVRLIRTHRYKPTKQDVIEKENKLNKLSTKKTTNFEVITPFIDKDDLSSKKTVYYKWISDIFKKYNIDIYIKNDTVAINYRADDNEREILDSVIIQNERITNSFKELFDVIKTQCKKK